VLFSAARGKGKSRQEQNECFTAAFLLTILFSLILWAALNIYEIPLLKMFGVSEELLSFGPKISDAGKVYSPDLSFHAVLGFFPAQ
jgi:Na+-driven multidrug efflux pump